MLILIPNPPQSWTEVKYYRTSENHLVQTMNATNGNVVWLPLASFD